MLIATYYLGILSPDPDETIDNYSEMGGLYSDLMSWALAMVDWDEVAASLIEDAKELTG